MKQIQFLVVLRFNINFNSDIVDFNEILGITNEDAILNLNKIQNNSIEIIARQFILRNNLSNLLTVDDLRITNITDSSALIESLTINFILSIRVTFVPLNCVYSYSQDEGRTVVWNRSGLSSDSSPDETRIFYRDNSWNSSPDETRIVYRDNSRNSSPNNKKNCNTT
ncbi:hypothetical protein [Spiroplasma endosymbiont of 'Nebria riversi']|uniref:hypothetical protein n=1 Tax=Spiroplasma endosymbiont of 'Nebria riversi' TaxID=2792084 RepID=UPI001C05C834|nr:hypothetical protein [Spiroplasma endosymbiont of 'Nebria riversi']